MLSGTPAAGTGGVYPIVITASNGISPNAAQGFNFTVIQPINQTIDFTAPASPIAFASNETVNLSATGGGSDNSVVFSIDASSTGTGSISGNVLTVTAAGSIVIDANQAGNSNYYPAGQVQQKLVVSQANQTTNFIAPPSPIIFVPNETVSLSAAGGGSGNTVVFSLDPSSTGTGSISGDTLTIAGAGTFVVDANQTGNSNYNPAGQVQRTLLVSEANQAINFTGPPSPVVFIPNETVNLSAVGGGSGNSVVFSIDASSTGTGTISGSDLTVTGAGNIVIDANEAGNSNQCRRLPADIGCKPGNPDDRFHRPGLADNLCFRRDGQPQCCRWRPSDNSVVFSIDAGSTDGTISGSVLTVTGAGNIVIDANQAGNNNCCAAAGQVQHHGWLSARQPRRSISPRCLRRSPCYR